MLCFVDDQYRRGVSVTCARIQKFLLKERNIKVKQQRIGNALKKMGLGWKKLWQKKEPSENIDTSC